MRIVVRQFVPMKTHQSYHNTSINLGGMYNETKKTSVYTGYVS